MSTIGQTAEERIRGRRPATLDVAADLRADRARARNSVRRRESISRRVLGVADALAVSCALIVGAVVVGHGELTLASLAVPPLFVVVAKTLGLYDRDEHLLHKTTLDEMPALVGLATLSALLLWLSGDLLINGSLGRTEVLVTWGTLLLADVAFRAVARWIARDIAPVERCVLVGDAVTAAELRERLVGNGSVKAVLVDWIPVGVDGMPEGDEGLAERLRRMTDAEGVDRVILGPVPGRSEELLDTIRRVGDRRLRVSVLPDVARVVDSTVELDRIDGVTLLGLRRFEMTRSSLMIKRASDVVGSAISLALLSPLFAVIALAIKLGSPGPILYRQRRAGRHGEPFLMLKFRSMVDGADKSRGARAPERGRRRLQDRRRPPDHARRPLAAAPSARRAAAARERPPRRDEPGRPAAAPRSRRTAASRAGTAAGSTYARDHGRLAGARLLAHPGQRDGAHRLPVRRQLVALERPPDPHADGAAGGPPPRALISSRTASKYIG